MANEKYQITEEGGELIISYRWMACQAYFLVFFCLFWNGFLVFWYTMAGASGNVLMMVFPIIHVAVGVGLTYYTICLFVNRTYIRVSKEEIGISFAPLPWKGAKTVSVKDIVQFYVKEKVSSGKNGTNYSYELWMRDKKGMDKKFASGPSINSVDDAKFLEKKIEQFLGIQDYQVDGEHAAQGKATIHERPRDQQIELNPIDITLKNLEKGYVLTYDLKPWEVVYEAQYDWSSGQTDRMYRLIPDGGGNMLLFVQHEMGVITPWVEKKLDGNHQAAFAKINPQTAPDELKFEDQLYWKQSFLTGKMFSSDNNQYVSLQQWFYKAT
ncbi:MAG: hypothetical protein ACPGJS_11320, partial [Flammeovirgaceae bacterium]